MKIAVCDDDLVFLQKIGAYIEQYNVKYHCNLEYHMFENPVELIDQIEKGIHYDAILLDVFMPGINGIQCAKEIRTYDNYVKIIFLTSSMEFAVESYDVKAYYYLLKPLQKENFFKILNQVIKEADSEKSNIFVFKSKAGITKISVSKLEYCETLNRKIILHMINGKEYECSLKMNDLEKALETFGMFFRPHRSFLANMDYIETLTYDNILMECGVKIPIPREKYSQIKQLYMEYMFQSSSLIPMGLEKSINHQDMKE